MSEASDEAALQFHQPDEGWTRESAIPDRRVSTPEQSAYSDEVIALVQAALRGADRTDREAFLLYGIEGFSLSEIAAITGRHVEAVRESVQRARDCVRSAPSLAGEFPPDTFSENPNLSISAPHLIGFKERRDDDPGRNP